MMDSSLDRGLFARMIVIGTGLLGGSAALAARRARLARQIVGLDRSADAAEVSRALGQIDSVAANYAEAFAALAPDEVRPLLVLAAVPVEKIATVLADAANAARRVISPNRLVLLTDTGSVRSGIAGEIAKKIGERPTGSLVYIGSHPIAGSEKSGPTAASADLFLGKTVILTEPNDNKIQAETPPEAQKLLADFWRALGAKVLTMTAVKQDAILAETSHLPHLTAAALAGTITPEFYPLAGTGLADTTRLASGNPDVWTNILLKNRENILNAAQQFQRQLARWTSALADGDAGTLHHLLTEAKERRDALGN